MFVTESAVGPLTPSSSSQRRSSVTAAEAVAATDSVTAAHRDSMTDAVAACLPTLPLAGSDSNVADALEVRAAAAAAWPRNCHAVGWTAGRASGL